MNHIELFAGCGGLSLGLESVGFKLLLANELSPMAAETFAYNFFEESLADLATASQPMKTLRTKWLSSNYPLEQLSKRLREDPRTAPALGTGVTDLASADLKGSLIVGSIVQLNQWLRDTPDAASALREGFGDGQVDLVSGGPPCQSFSMAGMREYGNSRNTLPIEFANFVSTVQPKMALLENVTGILRPFNVSGKKIYAWFEVAKAFAEANYVPLCLHVNAKFAGVAQNRPRFLMFLFRKDIFDSLLTNLCELEDELLLPSGRFFDLVKRDPDLEYSPEHLICFDVANSKHLQLYKKSFLAPLVQSCELQKQYSVFDAIDDLSKSGTKPSMYVKQLQKHLSPLLPPRQLENHQMRTNGDKVRRRFRIYQVIQQLPKSVQNDVGDLLAGKSTDISTESAILMSAFAYLGEDGKEKFFNKSNKNTLVKYLTRHTTKKQTQKALDPNSAAPAALSIPDDACHYAELRTLSVREMARIQSFPDNFVFRSKVTTGGQNRKFEVPQYTQVGNAVPPILGRAIGKVCEALLSKVHGAQKIETKHKNAEFA